MQYERGMAPAEQKIAGKLRQQLSDLSAKSHQVHVKFYYWQSNSQQTCIRQLPLGNGQLTAK